MKVWIDKRGGMHYHKPDCQIIHPTKPPFFKYEEIEHQIRHTRSGFPFDYTDIIGFVPKVARKWDFWNNSVFCSKSRNRMDSRKSADWRSIK